MSVGTSKVSTKTSVQVKRGAVTRWRDIEIIRYGCQDRSKLTIPVGPLTDRTVTIEVNVKDLIEALRRFQGSHP